MDILSFDSPLLVLNCTVWISKHIIDRGYIWWEYEVEWLRGTSRGATSVRKGGLNVTGERKRTQW